MELNRKKQCLILDGKTYNSENIHVLAQKADVSSSAELRDLYYFLNKWFDDSPWMTVHTSGSTGVPKELKVCKDRMMQSARLTCEYLNLKQGDTVLLCMDLRYIGAMMMVVRSLVGRLNLIVRPASGHPLIDVDQPLQFTAMVPLQVYNTLQVAEEKERLSKIEILIIGGGAISNALETEVKMFDNKVYSTYGMTETLSHIALRRLNGMEASDRYYPFSSVELSLSVDNTLIIKAPLVCDDVLVTNDVVCIYPDGGFVILGRKDNIINSGGVKIQAEEVEKLLQPLIAAPFVITCVPDDKLGEAVVLLVENIASVNDIRTELSNFLTSYLRPKFIKTVNQIPYTENGKIDRTSCRRLAMELLL